MTTPEVKHKRRGMKRWQIGVLVGMGGLNAIVLVAAALLLEQPKAPLTSDDIVRATIEANPIVADTPAPTHEPISTPAPTHLPAPANTPTLTGIGVSSRSVRKNFEDFGYTFQSAPPVSGQERWVGMSPNGLVILDLRGASNLVGTQFMFAVVDDDNTLTQNAADALFFITTVLPDWSNGVEWLSSHARDVMSTGDAAYASYRGIPIRFSRVGNESFGYSAAITVGVIP